MALRYLFGPVTAAFADQHLREMVGSGACLPFNQFGDVGFTISSSDRWQDLVARFPTDWHPDAVVLAMSYTVIPDCLWMAPVPIIGVVVDWQDLFHYLRLRLPACEIIAVDKRGAHVLRLAGVENVRVCMLNSCGQDLLDEAANHAAEVSAREIDIGYIGSLKASEPLERLSWLGRIAQLGDRWRVSIGPEVHYEDKGAFLRRTRIAFTHDLHGESAVIAFEAAAAGALVFIDRNDGFDGLEDRRECVEYSGDNLESLLDYYLTNEEERRSIAAAGRQRAAQCSFESQCNSFLGELEADWPVIVSRAMRRRPLDDASEFAARTWQAICAKGGNEPKLPSDLQQVLAEECATAEHWLAIGILSWLGEHRYSYSPSPNFVQARGAFEKALAADPEHPVAIVNLVEVLANLGEPEKATALARRGLALLARRDSLTPKAMSVAHYPPQFDDFRLQWEKAAWQNAGDALAESAAKKALLQARLHLILGTLTNDPLHLEEAVHAGPQNPQARVALGCTLGALGRPSEAVIHLEAAHRMNPFDAVAARSLYHAYREIGAIVDAEELIASRRRLARAAPELVPSEAWFSSADDARCQAAEIVNNRPRISLCMIVKNEESNLGDCLRTAADLVDEIVIVDTGSTDATKEIAESFGAKVVDFPWIDSFSAARNESLRHASGYWILWLDADDRLDDDNRAKLRQLIKSLGNDNLAFVIKCRCLNQSNIAGPTVVDHIRLFRNHPDLRWEHRIHEQILPSLRRCGATVRWTDIVVTHMGYIDPTLIRRKQERDLRLLLIEREELNDHPFTLFNLGSTYLELGLPKSALPVLKRSLERSAPTDSITRKLYVMVSQTFRKIGRIAEALDVCAAGRKHFPHDAELLFHEACVRDDLGDLAGARRCLEIALQSADEKHFASVSEGLSGPQIRQLLGQLWAKEGDAVEAERHFREGVDASPNWLPLWVEMGQLYLKGKRWHDLENLCARMDETLGPTMESCVLAARCHVAQGGFSEAISLLRSTIERYPKALWPRVIFSHSLLQEGSDFGAAEGALKAVLALDPGNQEASQNLSVLQATIAKKRIAV